jgi:hypothetical protein
MPVRSLVSGKDFEEGFRNMMTIAESQAVATR